MSASNELIHEQIVSLREKLLKASHQDRPLIEAQLRKLVEQLEGNLNALNEGKKVLKG